MTKHFAIIGGGFAGAQLAKTLEKTAKVTLIEPRSHFVHTPAMIRALVQPELLDRAVIPYNNLLASGSVIRERATGIDSSGVTLANGNKVDADYIVVATGSDNITPFKPVGDHIEAFKAEFASTHERINVANSIAIIGAGAVGVELAGEIAHFMPEKDVTLVSSNTTLFPDFQAKLGQSLTKKLEAAGVNIVKGARAVEMAKMDAPFSGKVELDNGSTVNADLIFPAIGSRAKTELFGELPNVSKSADGLVQTDAWLRPSDLPNVFAVGDVIDVGDGMTIVATSRQVPWLAKTLTALANGKNADDIKPYTPWNKAPILLPLGPKIGASSLVFFVAGNALTSAMKGKDLFLSKYNKMLGRG